MRKKYLHFTQTLGGWLTCTVLWMASCSVVARAGSTALSRAAHSALTTRPVRAEASGRTSTRSQISSPNSPTCTQQAQQCHYKQRGTFLFDYIF